MFLLQLLVCSINEVTLNVFDRQKQQDCDLNFRRGIRVPWPSIRVAAGVIRGESCVRKTIVPQVFMPCLGGSSGGFLAAV